MLIKKTWADIASESYDDSETNLQNIIQDKKFPKPFLIPIGNKPLSKSKHHPPSRLIVMFTKINFQLFCRWNLNFGTKTHLRRLPRQSCQVFISNQLPSTRPEPSMNLF